MDFIKTPRLYVDTPMSAGGTITLDKAQSHYLANVMRRNVGDALRVFNGLDGEWGGRISSLSKREVTIDLSEQLHEQPEEKRELHLIF
ncbi:MAG: RNA methyltransferase PUA domain-containing protein, partial [Pseudomonadota bacterium]|nr:RNA methyltransferase PUA domain-containing protein [Pseudomonadota bacterium]